MDKQVLTSFSTGEKSGRYAVGIFKDGMYYEYVFLMCSMHIYSHSSYTLIYKENGSNFHSCIPAKSTNRYPC